MTALAADTRATALMDQLETHTGVVWDYSTNPTANFVHLFQREQSVQVGAVWLFVVTKTKKEEEEQS